MTFLRFLARDFSAFIALVGAGWVFLKVTGCSGMSKILRENRASSASAMRAQSARPEGALGELLVIANAYDGELRTMDGRYRRVRDDEDVTLTMPCGLLRALPSLIDAVAWRLEATAPLHQVVLAWSGGVRLMQKDDMGQWRNMLGAPKRAPTHWLPLPPKPLSDSALGAQRRERGERNGRTQTLPSTDQ